MKQKINENSKLQEDYRHELLCWYHSLKMSTNESLSEDSRNAFSRQADKISKRVEKLKAILNSKSKKGKKNVHRQVSGRC